MQALFRAFPAALISLASLMLITLGLIPEVVAVPPPSIQTPRATQSTFVLYDGALNTGTPNTQGFVYLTDPPFVVSATQSFSNGVTTLDTTPKMSEYAGYFVNSGRYPPLDRQHGYQVLFTSQVVTESHVSNDRAGFSLLVLSDDLHGIELGFWTNQIWAQEGNGSALFTHAEGAAFNTTTDLINYRLVISGSAYNLSANGSPVLSGSLRVYTEAVLPQFPINPYTVPNLIFLGDDTSGAQAMIRLSSVSVVDQPPSYLYLPLLVQN